MLLLLRHHSLRKTLSNLADTIYAEKRMIESNWIMMRDAIGEL